MEMTQQQLNENILTQLAAIQKKLPNGELTSMAKAMEDMKKDISELKYTLLNPENGVIVKTNKNTEKTQDHEIRLEELEDKLYEVDELIKFKQTVGRVLWILLSAIVGIVVTMFSTSV